MKVFIETLGCPKNFNDSETVAGLLEKAGHEIAAIPSEADAIIVNTCGFINDAKKESIERIFDMSAYDKVLVISGCLTQRYGDELFDSIPEADLIIGVNDYDKLPELLSEYDRGCRAKGAREKLVSQYEKDISSMIRKISDEPYTATLKIAEGCNNRCTYCIIPMIRGPFRSVPMDELIAETKMLADAGTKELILIAQDTTAYGMDFDGKYHLAELLTELCKVDGIEWIRILYAYEDRITDELIDVMAREEKICNYLDIPLQHASDSVLRAMDRRSTHASIKRTLRKLRAAIDDIHIRTTLITGFPGETEEDFDELLDMVETERFDRLGVFTYSAEEGTAAAGMDGQIPEEIKEERMDAVMRRQLDISLENNQSKVGFVLDVIIDEEDDDGSYTGRTRYDAPEIDNAVLINTVKKHVPGDIIRVKIVDAFDYDLVGEEV